MKPLFWIGLVALVLGVLSLIVPLPSTQHEGVTIGDLSVGVETQRSEKLPPVASVAMILAGAGMMVFARKSG